MQHAGLQVRAQSRFFLPTTSSNRPINEHISNLTLCMWLVAVRSRLSVCSLSLFSFCSASWMSIHLLSEPLLPVLMLYSRFYLLQLDCSKNFTSYPHVFWCSSIQLFWWQHATTLTAQQIMSVRVPSPVSPTQLRQQVYFLIFFFFEKQISDNRYLKKHYMCKKSM